MLRMSLVRGGLVDLTIYNRRVASTPRFALMAVSPSLFAFLTKHPHAPAVNFTFDVAKACRQDCGSKAQLSLPKEKMSDAQIKIYEAALIEIAQWLTSLCTPRPKPITGTSLPVETCIRFICANILGAPEYVQHLTDKFVELAAKFALTGSQVTELIKSCRGEDDALLVSLAAKLIEKKFDNQISAKRMYGFLRADGNQLLKSKVEKLEKEMGLEPAGTVKESEAIFKNTEVEFEADNNDVNSHISRSKKARSRVYELVGGSEVDGDDQVVEIDVDGWEICQRDKKDGSPAKKQKFKHKNAGKG